MIALAKLPLWAKVAGAAGALITALAALAFGVAAVINAAGDLVDRGEAIADAKWEAKLALLEIEKRDAIAAARIEGARASEQAKAEAETRARSALKALQEARNADPDFDKAVSARWPAAYFDGVCGQRPGCLPPD